jgi:hypothetical protein
MGLFIGSGPVSRDFQVLCRPSKAGTWVEKYIAYYLEVIVEDWSYFIYQP